MQSSTVSTRRTSPLRRNRRHQSDESQASALKQLGQSMRRFALVPSLNVAALGLSAEPLRAQWRAFAWPTFRLPPFRVLRWWLLALLLLVALSIGLYWVHTDERWFVYRESVQFENVGYLNVDELYELSGVDSWNVFWLRSENVRQKLLTHPFIADAQVGISLPTHVTIRILPAEPVAVWLTNKGDFWLMANGYARSVDGIMNPLMPQLIDPMQEALDYNAAKLAKVEPGIMTNILSLVKRYSALTVFRYNSQIGLNFELPETGYYVYWGDDHDFDRKMNNLQIGYKLINDGDLIGTIIDVRSDRPFVR